MIEPSLLLLPDCLLEMALMVGALAMAACVPQADAVAVGKLAASASACGARHRKEARNGMAVKEARKLEKQEMQQQEA